MKRKNATRSALVTSIISLLLCVSMLVSTTFAWFTDEVVSGNNVIAAGNLDIELYYQVEGQQDWTKVTENTNVFMENALWEPGHTEVVKLKVVNEGTLALKYQLGVNVAGETTSETAKGELIKLSDHIKFAVIDGEKDFSRDEAVAEAEKQGATKLSVAYNTKSIELLPKTTANTDNEDVVTMVVYMPTTVGNEANYGKGKPVPTINLGIELYATQMMEENDSFGPDYDALASKWDGSTGTVPAEENGVITIMTGAELAAFAESVNAGATYAGKTVQLGASIDLGNNAWTPIGQNGDKAGFQGTFDGQGNVIYNLYVDQTTRAYQAAGLFGSARYATIKNFKIVNATINNLDDAGNTSNGAAVVVGAAQFATTIDNVDVENAKVTGNRRVAAIAGYYVGTITNCDVKNVHLTANFDEMSGGSYDNADKVGMIIAYSNGASTITDNTVTGGSISGYRDMGGIAGYATTSTLTGNKVADLNIVVNNAHNYKAYADLDAHDAGEIIGEGTADATNVATNVTFVKVDTVSTTEELLKALKAEEETVVISLANDISVDISTGNKYGGVNTKSVTVNGNGHTLTLSNTYRSYFNLANPDGKLYLNDMTLTNAHKGTHFFDYTTHFNCDLEATNVNFAKAPLIGSGTEATLTNCQYNQPGSSGYGLWIMSGADVTVTGGAVNSARGIKITDEDSAAAKTTLSVSGTDFNTNVKGAILVTTAHGADVNVSNVDITDCKADSTNAVWIDEDRAEDTATVTGATVIWEKNVITDSAALDNAIKAGKTEVKLAGGTYIIPDSAQQKTLTFIGLGDTVVATQDDGSYEGCDYSLDGTTATFENITINTDSTTYTGYARLKATYKNCTINGTYTLYGDSTFENCTFNVSGDIYNIWTWGGENVSFTDCTFNTSGKAILLYGNNNTKLTVTKCVFNDDNAYADVNNKAAIEVGSDWTTDNKQIIATNCTVNGFDVTTKGISTGSTLWGNKNSLPTNRLNVVIDGVDVY